MIITSTQTVEATDADGSLSVTTPAAAASGKHLYFFYARDDTGSTLTPPSGWTQLLAPAGGNVTVACWKLALSGAPDASYVVGSTGTTGNALGVIVCVDGEGGTFVSDTMVARTNGTGTTATTNTATNPAADVVALLAAFDFDVTATISTPPSGMTLQQHADGSASELAVYSEIGFTTGTRALVWSSSEDWSCYGIVARWTEPASGPTIDTQPTAQIARINGESDGPIATFTVAATSSGGSLVYDWELEDGVASGVYANVADGSGATWTGATGTSLVGTFTATTLTGRRVRCNVTDDNGTSTTNAVTLTVMAGPVTTASSSATSGSGVGTLTYHSDDPLATNGELLLWTVTAGSTGNTRDFYIVTRPA